MKSISAKEGGARYRTQAVYAAETSPAMKKNRIVKAAPEETRGKLTRQKNHFGGCVVVGWDAPGFESGTGVKSGNMRESARKR